MSSKYLCVHCGHRFSLEDDEEQRCPSCMRRGGLEKSGPDGASEAGSKRPAVIAAAAVVVVAIIGGGYAYWASRVPDSVSGEAPLEPLSLSTLRGYLREAGVSEDPRATFLEPHDAVEEWADSVLGDEEGYAASARALASRLSELREEGAHRPWSHTTPLDREPRAPSETLVSLRSEEAERAYSLELAMLATTALRSRDVPAMVAEVWSVPGAHRPPDPSGQMGYFALAVPPSEDAEQASVLFDVHGEIGEIPEGTEHRILSDPRAIAAALNLSALHTLVHRGDLGAALERVDAALELDPRAPYLRDARAAVLLSTRAVEEARSELQAAIQIRDDGPQRVNAAALAMAERDFASATRDLARAIEDYPDYALAHARLAAAHLEQGDEALARASLEEAERLDPRIPALPLTWARYHLSRGEEAQASQRAHAAVEQHGDQWAIRLFAAQIFRAVGEDNEMRTQVQAVLEMVPPERRGEVEQRVRSVLGDDALEPPEEGAAGGDLRLDLPALSGGAPGDLGLDLGSGGEVGGDAQLELGADEAEEGPAIMMGDPSDYRLLGPNDRLELQLSQ